MSKIRFLELALLFLTGGYIFAAPVKDSSPLWPTYRHDSTRAGISPLQGGLQDAPELLWEIDLGGDMQPAQFTRDLDLDGDDRAETLVSSLDAVWSVAPDGRELWKAEGLPQAKILWTPDLNGNGRRSVLVESNSQRARSIDLIDGPSGTRYPLLSWHSAFGYRTGVGSVWHSSAGQTQFYAVWDGWNPGGSGQIMNFHLWGTDPDSGAVQELFHGSETGNIFGAQFVVADANGDMRENLIMVSMEQAWVYDWEDAESRTYHAWQPGIRSYSAYIAAHRDKKDLVLTMINPHIPGVQAVALGANGQTRRLWKMVAGAKEDQYQQTVKITPACPDPIVDLDGDGRFEILVSIVNEHGDQQTNTVILDSATGLRLHESTPAIITVANLDGRSQPEMLRRNGDFVQAVRWNGHAMEVLWERRHVEVPLLLGGFSDYSRTEPGERPRDNPTLYREGNHFILRLADEFWLCSLSGNGLDKVKQIQGLPATSPDVITARVTARHKTYMPPPAMVGWLSSQVEIILRRHDGTLIGLDRQGRQKRQWLKDSPSHPHNYENHFSQIEIVDVDGNGTNDLITTTSQQAQGAGRIVVLNDHGQEQLSISAVPGATEICFGATGSMGKQGPLWITAAYRLANGAPVEVAYEGKTGAELWRKENYGGDLVRFGYPCATLDYDKNGSDEMVVSAGNYFGILDVSSNRDLIGPVTLGPSHLPGHWSTRFRTILIPGKDSPPDVFLHRNNGVTAALSLSGAYRWHYSLYPRDNMPFNQEAIADLDGDGHYEVVTAHRDGTLRAFNNQAVDKRCPTCKKDTPLTRHNRAGQVRWTFKIPGPVNPSVYRSDQDFATADLDGDGRMELLLGGGDGRLYALEEIKGQCRVLWTLKLSDRRIGSPVLADLDGDGTAEILVPAEDGRMFCLGKPTSKEQCL